MSVVESKWRPSNLRRLAVGVTLVIVAALLGHILALRSELKGKEDTLGKDRVRLSIATSERSALLELINRQPWLGSFVTGFDTRSNSSFRIEQPRDGLYYFIRVECGLCAENFDYLSSLSPAMRERVLIVAMNDNPEQVGAYAAHYALSSRVIASPDGSLIKNLPSLAVPATVLFHRGKVRALIIGLIDSLQSTQLRESLAQMNGDRR